VGIGFGSGPTGVFTQNIVAGQTYGIGLSPNAEAIFPPVAGQTVGDDSEHVNGNFLWSITGSGRGGGGVPEPASWAMILLGFGGLGLAMRSRPKGVDASASIQTQASAEA
jgi:hypothetical protein